MAASTASHRPIKGILKNKSSTTSSMVSSAEQPGRSVDEELSMVGDDEDALSDSETTEALTPDMLAKKLAAAEGSEPKYRVHEQESSEDEDSDLSPEEQEKKRQFEMKRKLHYNEGLNIKLARQLISKDLNDDEEDEEMSETAAGERMNTEESNQGSTTSDRLQKKSQNS
ncbi:protein phosphatase 1 regulatory inhibitor subunit 2 [Rhinolophus ferrumequinum]|uniref:Protein phosphatase 1 regulatory inhibitor subunit 2 n=1 Tax=Rhinolophus ferrumequinum TaxID=59479 RepID=A0A7J8AGJ7_RHIFE|nr:protein phosphatase 1 regulatory inhibitor subunit 2 [Rhinolophus ferrumequinum]